MKYKRYRKDFEHSYAFGVFPALELLKHRPDLALEVFLKEKAVESEGGQMLAKAAEAAGVAVTVNDRQIDALSPKEKCNAVAVFRKGREDCPESSARVSSDAAQQVLCLHQPDNMGNLGTILRTALGFGWRELAIVRPAVDCWDPKVVRASMGAVFQMTIKYYEDWQSLVGSQQELPRYALALAEGAAQLGTFTLPQQCMLVFGNEGAGLPEEVVSDCKPVIIPQASAVDSFNLGVAVGITLWEHRRENPLQQ